MHTQPNSENLAVAHLERQGFHVWLPCYGRIVKHARPTKSVRCPLFPGYLFINLDLETTRWCTINSTEGVKNIVSCGVAPLVLESQFITALKASEGLDAGNRVTVPLKMLGHFARGQIGRKAIAGTLYFASKIAVAIRSLLMKSLCVGVCVSPALR